MHASHVVVDEHDGYTFWRDADGQLFTGGTARKFADTRNAEMKPEHCRYKVFVLIPVLTGAERKELRKKSREEARERFANESA